MIEAWAVTTVEGDILSLHTNELDAISCCGASGFKIVVQLVESLVIDLAAKIAHDSVDQFDDPYCCTPLARQIESRIMMLHTRRRR